MVKTHKNLFEKICSFENLFDAYLKTRRRKRYKVAVLKFSYNLEENLMKIKEELEKQIYRHGNYVSFQVVDQKKRTIKAVPFRDRIVHHALCNVIEPIFDKIFIYDSYACRKEKGSHFGANRLTKFLRKHRKDKLYALKCDIKKYFESMDHEILLKIISRKINDEKVLWLVREIVESDCSEKGKGIPIGNLTSQLFANVYLNELDYFVKHKLRIKYYLRYVDDFVILHESKEKLKEVKQEIIGFLKEKLKLELHEKKQNIFPVSNGIDFLGYRIFHSHRRIRRSNIRKFIKRNKELTRRYQKGIIEFEKIRASINSWLGYVSHADSFGLRKKILGELGIYLPLGLRNEHKFKVVVPDSLRV